MKCQGDVLNLRINRCVMSKPQSIPFSRMQKISASGVFVKRFGQSGRVPMKPYAHRDDYYILALLTEGNVAVEIDFERKELQAGDILIVSPWQVHNRPEGESWDADGWMLAFSPEMLTEQEAGIIEEYSISPSPFSPDDAVTDDVVTLCSMMDRNKENNAVFGALAVAVKSIVLSTLNTNDTAVSGRYRAITLRLRKLLDIHLVVEKSPAAYASMMNISEVYLNEAVKGATGLSVGAYIRNMVMVRAKRQLAYTSLSAKEIAYALGYEDYAHFSKLFSKSTGMSPSEYRKNLK